MVWKRFKLQRTCSWNISRLGLEVVLSPPSQNTSSFRTALTVSVWILSHLPHQKASPCRLQDPGCHLCTISTNPPFTVEALHVWSCRVCSSGLFLSRTRHGLEHTEMYRWIRWSRIFGTNSMNVPMRTPITDFVGILFKCQRLGPSLFSSAEISSWPLQRYGFH